MIPTPERAARHLPGLAAMLALACLACADAPVPAPALTYSLILAEARERLHLEPPVALHPLLALLELDDGPDQISLLRFNDFDTTAVPAIVQAEPGLYRLCTPGAAGGCQVEPGHNALILSDILDLGANGLAVVLVLTDRRRDADFLQYWGARVKPGWRGWDVVEFRRF
jgi:hypothetical protein